VNIVVYYAGNIIGSIYNCKIGPGGAASKEDAAPKLNATNK
jgi:hypothetical protein